MESKKIFYEKIGRKYVPVKEYDPDLLDAFTYGNHLVMCYPGGSSRRYNINPDYAAMIAAAHVAERAVVKAILAESELRPVKTLLTEEQRSAWCNLAEKLGDDLATLTSSSVHDSVQAGINAMIQQAEKLLSNPTVRAAYEQFLLTAELSKEHENGKY